MSQRGPVDRVGRAIAVIARRQGGHIAHRQLKALGLSQKAIRHRIERGLLIAVFNQVYAVGHLPTNPIDRAHGALLACGPTAALSHRSAASLYGVFKDWRLPFEVIVSGDRRPSGVRVRRSAMLAKRDICVHQGIRVTSPALTILQIAPATSEKRLTRAINALRLADRHRLTTSQLDDVLDRFPRHPGARGLRPLVALLPKEPSRSDWEDEWPPFAAAYDLPPYTMNERVCGHRVDVHFPSEQLIVELDGWETHQSREAFEEDRARDAEILATAGIPTARLTHRQLHGAPAEHAARLHLILARRQEEVRRAA